MGPKKSEPALKDDYWRTYIEDTPLNDQSWSVQVVMMEVAGSDQDRIYLNKFEVFAAEEKRFVIKNICKSETMFMINQLGGEKKVKDESLRVFEEGQAYLKDKKDIPPDIQALIVKHLILKMKEEYLYIQKQQLHVRDGMRRESATMVDRTEVRGTVCVPPPEPPEPPPQPPAKGKKGEAEPAAPVDEPEEGKKYNTLLRVRGEEWRDKVYVDDFPIDGPNLYVAVSGFMEPQLAGCLIKIGVPLSAIFQIRIDLAAHHVPSSLTRPTKRGQSQTEFLIEKSLIFWQDLQQLRINKDTADDYNNTAFVIFSPPYCSTEGLSGNPEKIYDELCFLMYDIQDLTRQRSHYLQNMEIIHIPTELKDVSYEHYYYQYVDDIPLECCNMYSILDSVLQAVCRKQDLSKDSSRTSLSAAVTLNQQNTNPEIKVEKAETLVKDVFNALTATECNKKSYRLTYGEESETHKDPIVINFGDFAKRQTFHLDNVILDDVVFSMLSGMPVNKLWLKQERPEAELEAKINFHVNVLLSCFHRTDVETAELNRLLHILACRKLYNNRSSLKKIHLSSITVSEFKKLYLRRSVLAEPLPKGIPLIVSSSTTAHSFPSMTKIENNSAVASPGDSEERRIRFLFDCPDISELVSALEIATDKIYDHIIDDFELFEDFSGTRAFQILRDAFTNFNCLDYKYCEVTDTFNLMFFNSHDKDGISREEWRSHLPTPVCLQDFFDFVLEEHYDWIENEEKLYEQKLAQDSQSQCAAVDPHALQSCIENQDVETELLIEGSLKFQEAAKLEVPGELTMNDSPSLPDKLGTSAPPSTTVESKSSKKTKTAAVSSPTSSFDESNTDVLIPSKPFAGYDLGDRRLEVFGKDGTFFSRDGTRVSSRYTFLIPMNLENVTLNVVPGNSLNEFWVHKTLGDSVSPEIMDACESFRVTSKYQVTINIKKEVYSVPIPLTTASLLDNDTTKTKEAVLKTTSQEELPIPLETNTYHSFSVTWPNGLITESVHEDNSSVLSHIKQYYIVPTPHLDEEMRCISLNGEVIIFKNSGDIEVLRSDGTYIKITKYKKRVVEPPPDIISAEVNNTPDKNKKSQAENDKIKKEKSAKLSSKTSKNSELEQEKLPSVIQEYELCIDEFEIVETSGLRQQWVGECSFDIERLLIRTATDYCVGEVFSRRMDGTQVLLNKDGVQIVTFPNLTRIITRFVVEDQEIYPEWTEEESYYFDVVDSEYASIKSKHSMSQKSNVSSISRHQSHLSSMSKRFEEEDRKDKVRTDGYISVQTSYTIEHENFASVTVSKVDGKVIVDSPNNTSVILKSDGQYEINLDSATSASFDGEDLKINYEACPECQSKTTCKIKICREDINSVTKSQRCWLRLEDSFGKKISVNEEGAINLVDEQNEHLNTSVDTAVLSPVSAVHFEEAEVLDDNIIPSKSNTTDVHGKCRKMYSAKEMRFFILRRDLTCSELVHRVLLERDMKDCRFQPWCSINEYDAFGDHRSLLSLLTPVSLTESEKWIMNSQFSGKPKSLKYKDLKKDSGKGFYHWMRPYKRFKPKQLCDDLTPKLPRAFILRILEKQWKERDRVELKGARELLRAVLKYRRVMESDSETILHMPLVDQRSESARHVDEVVQALGHRIYEEVKTRLDMTVMSRAKPDITTKPSPQQFSFEELDAEQEPEMDAVKALEAERDNLIREAQVHEVSPNLKRYWLRRGEEFKEEQFYLYLLREGSVPPYFRNVLGGAIWWEMNSAADSAVDVAERRRMKCVCADKHDAEEELEPFM